MTIGETGIDATVAHSARRYNYWLGGQDNVAADRASGDEIERKVPGMRAALPLVRELLGAPPSGSYLATTHFTTDASRISMPAAAGRKP
jgi:hypothetical protein